MGAHLHCPDGCRQERGHSVGTDSSLWQVIPCGDTPDIVLRSFGTVGRMRELHAACARVGILSCCRLPRLREGVGCSQAH